MKTVKRTPTPKTKATTAAGNKPVAATATATARTLQATTTTPATKPSAQPPTTATIEAQIDVGFGNRLFLRGSGPGLSWDRGIPLTCLDGKTWRCSVEARGPLSFKLLLNDAVWSKGEDLVAAPGQKVQITPSF